MVFECPDPAALLDRNNWVYCPACSSGTLAFSIDIPRVYFARDSNCCFGMAWKNVVPNAGPDFRLGLTAPRIALARSTVAQRSRVGLGVEGFNLRG